MILIFYGFSRRRLHTCIDFYDAGKFLKLEVRWVCGFFFLLIKNKSLNVI